MIVSLQKRIVAIFAFLCVLPWVYLQKDVVVPADMAWLTGAAQHILAGHKMSDFFYDNNPPLCYIIYIPVALLVGAGLPMWVATYVFTMGYVAFFTALVARLLQATPGVEGARFWLVLGGYFIAVTALCQLEFGNKDHLIAVALFPFLLGQYVLTYRLNVPRWVPRLAIIAAVPLILVKPHYGLPCVLMLIHRFWKDRRFSIIFDFDFLALAIGVVLYAASIAIWFPDFISEILIPFSINLYAGVIIKDVFLPSIGMGLLSICLLTLAFFEDENRESRRFSLFLCWMALAAIIPFFVQLKGFYLHMLPAVSLLVPAAFITGSLYIKKFSLYRPMAAIMVIAGIAIFSYFFMSKNSYATHSDFRKSSLEEYVNKHAKGSSFLMQSVTTNIVVPVSVYTGIPHATRFSSFWFMDALYRSRNRGEMSDYISRLVAEDINRYRPAFIALYHDPAPGDDFLKMFQGHPAFDEAWAGYHKTDEFKMDYNQYYKRKLYKIYGYNRFDIYERR